MRQLQSHPDESADVVIACDNAVPHLLTDGEIRARARYYAVSIGTLMRLMTEADLPAFAG